MSLTINQEKQLRAARDSVKVIDPTSPSIHRVLLLEELAGKVKLYRRAQKLPSSNEASDLRKSLLVEIDGLLDCIGVE